MTNLIEQLGGYEKAKGIFILNDDDYEFYSPHFEYYSEKAVYDDSLDIKNIEHVLLEHRRQHNIFEVGDWIIYDDDLMVFAMWSKHHNEYAYIGYANADDGALEHRSAFRHATDEEIAQGYRDE